MTRVRMRFEGGRELEGALGRLGTLYRRKKAARDALLEGAAPIHAAAQANAPQRAGGPEKRFTVGGQSKTRRRGALKIHVGIGTRLNRSQARQNRDKMPVEVYIGTRDRAGRLTEFGTRFAAALGWFRRAWDANKMQALEIIGAALWRQISRQAELEARAAQRAARRGARRGRRSGVAS
jgi:HK97 gp10 family phage protein